MVAPSRATKRAPKAPALPSVEEVEDGFRRRSDEILWQMHQERFAGINEDLSELARTLHGHGGEPGLLGRVAGIEATLGTLVGLVNTLVAGRQPEKPEAVEDKPLTTARLAEMALKFMQPVLTAVLIWLLLTFFPNALALLNKP